MATKEKVLSVLNAQGGAISLKQLSSIIGEPQGNFFTQLQRMQKANPPLVLQDDSKNWEITEVGRQSLQQAQDEDERPPDEVLRASDEPVAVISEYQKFMQLGRQSGISNQPLLKATCDHVWAGDFHDLEWVHAALIQANISPDLANRWVAFWGSYLKKAIPPELEEKMTGSRVGRDGQVTEGKTFRSKMTHIIDQTTGLPLWVGEGQGDYTYDDAKDLSRQFLASRSRSVVAANSGPQPDSIDQALKIMEFVKAQKAEEGGGATPPRSYLIKMNPDGTSSVEEVDPGKPTVVQVGAAATPAQGSAGLTSQVDQIMALVNALVSLGVVVKPGQNPALPPQKVIYLDKDGKPIEAPPGQPIVIYRDSPAQTPAPAGIALPGANGEPGPVLNIAQLDAYFKIEDWRDRRRREEEAHQSRQDLIKSVSKAVPDVLKGAQDYLSSRKEAPNGNE
ncbi:hypothetical protein [Halothiobacillus sp.]|uniref:hypothetical protein n=1 Tax=Halothiobacillus sp. TaxID=1891311 RepID=UPI002613EF8C|nr:hypothetical protein [Halothiobacillus sp.]MDD4967308.1 hypothetical protein [Halothiobacillus sp.]